MAASYSSTVSKKADTSVPAADRIAHHVKGSNGKTVKFKNPHASYGRVIGAPEIVSRLLWSQIKGETPAPSLKDNKTLSVNPTFLPQRTASDQLRVTWLGHACSYVEFPSGLRVLFDPVFEDRCAPVQWWGPKRYCAPPCSLADLPAVDAVVISHSHYDHLSHPSILEIAKRNPNVHFFVGLGLADWFKASGIAADKVTEMDWWEDADLVLKREGPQGADPETITARLSCLPSQHSSGRTGLDRDCTLWTSWSVVSGDKSVWFAGDTGFRSVPRLDPAVDDYGPDYDSLPRCPQFEQIGRLRGPFDLGLIPIGAYQPRWIMSPMHANPFDAVEIFKETRCKRAMGIHWGTWVLTTEDVQEPPRLLKEALRKSGIEETGVFDVCAVGESWEV